MPMATGAREHLKLNLWVESLRCCGSVVLKAWGTSMLPSVWPSDLLTIQNVSTEEIVPGDIVLVLRNHRFFIHRLVEKRPGLHGHSWITKGDAMRHNDPPVTGLLGRVTEIRRGNRSLAPRRRMSRVQSAMAWILGHSHRFRNLALRVHAVRLQADPAHAERFVRTIRSALCISLSRTLRG
jgi:hypothetical protein